jgi:O-antigen/teichoic acid export membrane protein
MSLTQQVFTGLKWTAITRFSTQILNWVVTLIVIRLLTPADYGLLAIATGVVAVLTMLNEMGLESALVQRKELEADLPAKVFGFVIGTNLFFFTFLMLMAPVAAGFYSDPLLTDIIRVLALNCLLWPFMVVPRAMLVRRMDFRSQGIVMFAATTSGSLMTLALALTGHGVWSLVWGNITETVIRLVGILIVADFWCRPKFTIRGMRKVVEFGATVTVTKAIWNLQMQVDSLIIGKVLGKEPTGIYSVAKDLAWLPMRKIANIVNPVAFAGFSRAHSNGEDVNVYLVKASKLLAIVSFPVFFGLSSIAPELVAVVLGEHWLDTITPLAVLAPVVTLQMLGTALGPALAGTGRPIVNLYQRLINLVVLIACLAVGLYWGIVGVSIGVAISYCIGFFIQVAMSCRALQLAKRTYFSSIFTPFMAAVIMYFAVVAMRILIDAWGPGSITTLVMLCGVGAMTYIGTLLLLDARNVLDSISTLRSGLSS